MNVQRYVNMTFVGVGLLTWMIVGAAMATLFDWVNPDWNPALLGAKFTLADLIGLVAGIAMTLGLWRHPRVNTVAFEIANELKKVTWPTWKETRISTVVVIVTTIIVAIILGLFDAMWAWATSFVYVAAPQFTFFSVLGLLLILGGTGLLFYFAGRD